ncbi:MAG TPA: helix-turn-helix domain-containing protein [Vicinamibacterales bacterium]|nr:helix-turn-helix domain-containing protein [Vicinamibacterales bacterium]
MTTWLTPREAAQYARLNEVTLRRAVKSGDLTAFRVNGKRQVRFRAVDLDAWLAKHQVQAS